MDFNIQFQHSSKAGYYNLNHSLWKVLDWVFPPECACCGKSGFRICPTCFEMIQCIHREQCLNCLKPINQNPPFCNICTADISFCKDLAAWGVYDSSLRDAIHSMKYHRNLGLGDFFAPYLIELLEKLPWSYDMVVPIPLSKHRQHKRGYNQAALLSRPIAWYFGKEHGHGVLERIKETETQFKLSLKDREVNMKDAFSANPAKLIGKSVLLVDDIITTGATLNSAASALLDRGAKEVFGISIAKAVKLITQES